MNGTGESVTRYLVTKQIIVEAEDHGPAITEAEKLWAAKGTEGHNERARHGASTSVRTAKVDDLPYHMRQSDGGPDA